MAPDPIVEQIRAGRDAYARSHGYNLQAIVADLQRRQAEGRRKVVSLPPKRLPIAAEAPKNRRRAALS